MFTGTANEQTGEHSLQHRENTLTIFNSKLISTYDNFIPFLKLSVEPTVHLDFWILPYRTDEAKYNNF
jgi:hypothetical protein